MFTYAELIDAIDQIEQGKHSIQNCERLAAIYTVLDHLYGKEKPMMVEVSHDNKIETEVGHYGVSNFLESVAGKSAKEAWLLMDELVDALIVLNPRLMNNFFEKLNNLK